MKKNQRHQLILNIIQNQKIATQEELVASLREEGLEVTQATVSRDIKSLKLVKEPLDGGSFYRLPGNPGRERRNTTNTLQDVVRDYVTDVHMASPLVVLRTLPGGAATVAFYLDEERLPGVLGTIAGDDTVFVAARGADAAAEVLEGLKGCMRSAC